MMTVPCGDPVCAGRCDKCITLTMEDDSLDSLLEALISRGTKLQGYSLSPEELHVLVRYIERLEEKLP